MEGIIWFGGIVLMLIGAFVTHVVRHRLTVRREALEACIRRHPASRPDAADYQLAKWKQARS